MKGTYHIATMFGVPVKIHWSFFLLPAWAVGSSVYNGMSWYSASWFLTYILTLFFCVLLHEFGHILMARHFGVDTQDVILTPIGGMARLHRMPEKPRNEFFVSIAGPLVNVVIAALLSPTLLYSSMGELLAMEDIDLLFSGPKYFIRILIAANLMLVAFNLIPAFPLDGGRVLRAGLSYKLGRRRGTRIAAIVGKILATGLFAIGIYLAAPSFVLIGIFVFVMGTLEYKSIANEAVLAEDDVREVINPDFAKIYDTTSMQDVFRVYSVGTSKEFVVMTESHFLLGMLAQKEIEQALLADDLEGLAEKYFRPMSIYLALDMKLNYADMLIRQSGLSMLPVVEEGRVVGALSRENIQHYMRFKRRMMTLNLKRNPLRKKAI